MAIFETASTVLFGHCFSHTIGTMERHGYVPSSIPGVNASVPGLTLFSRRSQLYNANWSCWSYFLRASHCTLAGSTGQGLCSKNAIVPFHLCSPSHCGKSDTSCVVPTLLDPEMAFIWPMTPYIYVFCILCRRLDLRFAESQLTFACLVNRVGRSVPLQAIYHPSATFFDQPANMAPTTPDPSHYIPKPVPIRYVLQDQQWEYVGD